MNKLPNIEFKKPQHNPTIDSEYSMFELPFYKTIDYFANIDNFVRFVKGVENMVRTSPYYKKYISYLKNDLGLNYCQVLSNIKSESEKEKIEIHMHHGPILTLFDVVSIVTDSLLARDEKVNTFIVADKVIEEHFNNNIQVVMLSETVHEEVHANNIFINLKQAFGDINTFIKKYRDGLNDEYIDKINKYIETSLKYDSFDNETLKLRETIKCWAKK